MLFIVWKKILSFFKKYWGYVAVFFAGLIGYLILQKNQDDEPDTKPIRDSHKDQLDKIDNIRNDERKSQDEADKKLKSDLKIVEQEYEKNKKELDEKKKDEIKEILKTHQDDPVGLAKKLSEVTGFKIIMPED